MAVTLTMIASTYSTVNASSYALSTCTPAVCALLFCLAWTTGSIDPVGDVTATTGNTYQWTRILRQPFNTNVDCFYAFVTTTSYVASAVTFTFACSGDAGTGANVQIWQATNGSTFMPIYRATVVSGSTANPSITLSSNANTINGVIASYGATRAASAMILPAFYTLPTSGQYGTPAACCFTGIRNSGEVSSTITFNTGAGAFAFAIIEVNDSAGLSQFNGMMGNRVGFFGV